MKLFKESQSHKIPGSIKQKRKTSLMQSCIHKQNNSILKKILSLTAKGAWIPDGKIVQDLFGKWQEFSKKGRVPLVLKAKLHNLHT